MFRILILSIFFICNLTAAVGDNSVTEDSGFKYSLKENGNGSVRYINPEYDYYGDMDDYNSNHLRDRLREISMDDLFE